LDEIESYNITRRMPFLVIVLYYYWCNC
jgi:hypothetical protein